MRTVWILLAGLFAGLAAQAQLDNSAFELPTKMRYDSVGDVYFRAHALGFNRNNEYFHPNEPGRTYFGFQLQPEIGINLRENVRFSGGVFVRQDFGNPNPYQVMPIYRAEIDFDSLTMVFGSLYGGLQHDLPLPIYAFERSLDDRVEEGLQFLYKNKGFRGDLWVDWQKMIYDNANEQERIWAGFVGSHRTETENMYAKFALKMTVYHEGGQIDTTDEALVIWTNTAFETKVGKKFDKKFLHELYASYHWLHWDNFSPDTRGLTNGGIGHIFSGGMKTKFGGVQIDYHENHNYHAPFASDIYTTYPTSGPFQSEIHFKKVSILSLRFLNDIPISEGITLTTRFEPLYDFTRGRFTFNNGLYLNINEQFWLGNFGKRFAKKPRQMP